MSYKYGTALVPGAYHYGLGGLGIAGALVPSSGEHGPGYLYNDLALPADNAIEVRGLIIAFPVGLASFNVGEDSNFDATGPDGTYQFTYRLYADGVDLGTAVVTFTLGAGVSLLSGAVVLGDLVASGFFGGIAGLVSDARYVVSRVKRKFRVWR